MNILSSFQNDWTGNLKSRIVMAAMTRGFADAEHRATHLIRDYYQRRAEGGVGLILTEGIVIHQTADGYNHVPHLQTMEQARSWAPVIEAVHQYQTKIYAQLWHCGRISHPDYTGGVPPWSSTDVAAEGIHRQNNKPFGQPRALTPESIQEVHQQYLTATQNALNVGFDGVQLHLGHGYLADSFFDSRINTRTDLYGGGSVQNRCRFALELVEKVMKTTPASKVIVRISPSRDMGGVIDWPDLNPMLDYLIPELWNLGVRVLDVSCARADYYQTSGRCIRHIRPLWKGVLMGGASLTLEQANKELNEGLLDLITFGRLLIANPDLGKKTANGQKWVDFQPEMLKELS